MIKPKKTNLPSLPEAPDIVMYNNKTKTLNNPSVINIKSLPSTSQTCIESLLSRSQKHNVAVLSLDNEKGKEKIIFSVIIN